MNLFTATTNRAARRQSGGRSPVQANASGAALFMAISLLALFSLLGAVWMRFVSLELEESDLRIQEMRARHYAAAGVYSAAGHIQQAVSQNTPPAPTHLFSYPLYGKVQGKTDGMPSPLDAYLGEAAVSINPINQQMWDARFANGPIWPGEGHAFLVSSKAELKKAGPGSMLVLAHCAVEAVLIAQNDCCDVIYWNSVKNEEERK